MGFPSFTKFIEQADQIAGSRSSVLVPLQLFSVIFAALFVFLIFAKAPSWALIGDGVFVACLAISGIASYWYFAIKSPEHLRSEEYSLSKHAMELGLYGDNDAGLFKIQRSLRESPNPVMLQAGSKIVGDE